VLIKTEYLDLKVITVNHDDCRKWYNPSDVTINKALQSANIPFKLSFDKLCGLLISNK
jgi:hypothetical protein